jgi:hypothetical protein
MDEEENELTFTEAMLSDMATDIARIRRNTGFVAGVLMAYLTIIAALFLVSIFTTPTSG